MTASQLATIDHGKTWLPLLAVQRRSHSIGYSMPVREYACSADAAAASAAARARLRSGPVLLAAPLAEVTPVAPTPAEPIVVTHGAPLNMLTLCHWRFLVALAALRHGCEAEAVIGRTRPKVIAAARQEAFYLVARHTVFSIARIARMFDRDHTTVIHALKKFPPIVRPRVSSIAHAPAIRTPEMAARVKTVADGYAAALPVAAIAEQIGMSPSTVKQLAMRHHIRHPGKPFYGPDSEAAAQ